MTREEAIKLLQVTKLMLLDGANQPISDLYYALGMAIEALEQTENSSEKPNNSTISKMESVEDEPQITMDCSKCERYKDGGELCDFCAIKDEPQTEHKCIDCMFLTYKFGKTWCNIKCENPHDKVCDRFKPKYEPQTDCAWR